MRERNDRERENTWENQEKTQQRTINREKISARQTNPQHQTVPSKPLTVHRSGPAIPVKASVGTGTEN